jgi:photosystem II stability/assembly factor-like uncharacterized protein
MRSQVSPLTLGGVLIAAMSTAAVVFGPSTAGATLIAPHPAKRAATPDRRLPPDILNFTPIGTHTAWITITGNGLHHPSQSVLRSVDGGASWSDVTPPGLEKVNGPTAIGSTDFISSARGWVTYGPVQDGRQTTLLTTSDGGRTWRRIGPTPRNCQVQFINRRDGWCVALGAALGSEYPVIDRTTDGGHSWRVVSRTTLPGSRSTPDPIPFSCDKSVSFTSPTVGFAGSECSASGGWIYATHDGGSRWRERLRLATSTPSLLSAFTPVVGTARNEAVGVHLTSARGRERTATFYRSSDGGQRWAQVNPPGRPSDDGIAMVSPLVWTLQMNARNLLATADAGRTWTRVTTNVALPRGLQDDFRFTTADVGWDLAPGAGPNHLLHTTDGGRRWTTVNVPGL